MKGCAGMFKGLFTPRAARSSAARQRAEQRGKETLCYLLLLAASVSHPKFNIYPIQNHIYQIQNLL